MTISFTQIKGQCVTSYINWDLQYVKTGGYTIGTTGTRFAIGANSMLLTTTGAITSSGANGTHTANTGVSSNGALDPTANNDADFTIGTGVMKFAFHDTVGSVSFTLNDIDVSHSVVVTAKKRGISVPVTLSAIGSTLSTSGSGTISATITGGSGTIGNTLSTATATINVSSAVDTIILSFTKASGTDNIWLSDISACVYKQYVANYQAIGIPDSGEAEYFLGSFSNHINIINASTGAATVLYSDPGTANINSLAYDPYNQIVYYTKDSITSTNKTIFKYDVKTNTKSTFIADVTVAPYNMVLSTGGLGSGAATFYNGSLFIGIETSTANDAAGAYRIDFASDNITPILASRLFLKNGANSGGQLLGYGDFVADNGTFYLTNNGTETNKFQIYNFNSSTYNSGFTTYPGQISMNSASTPRGVNASFQFSMYTGSGTWGPTTSITGGTGTIVNDASEVFKFPSDYGDAPTSYGKVYHRYVKPSLLTLRLGSNVDYEVITRNSTLSDADDLNNTGVSDDEDGISSFPVLNTTTTSYSLTTSLLNSSGANAFLYGWIDFNRNNIFDSGERANVTVANGTTSATLTWSSISGVEAGLSHVRIRYGSSSTEVSSPKGGALNGEIEDYPINIQLQIAGTIWDDADSSKTQNGTEATTNVGNSLWIYLDSSGIIKDSSRILPNGTYTLNANANTSYNLVLSTVVRAIGSSTPASNLPSAWSATGTNFNGVITSNVSSGNITTTTSNLTNINFGIEARPTSVNSVATSQPNPGGTNQVSVSATLFSGTDTLDLVGTGLVSNMRITKFPSNATSIVINGISYTSSTFPASGVTVPTNSSGNPTQAITIDPINGTVTPVISYVTIDNAGRFSDTATVSIPFNDISISGTVYNDANGINNSLIDGVGMGQPSGTQLYAYLVDSLGIALGKVLVDSNGNYTINTNNGLQTNRNNRILLSTTNSAIGSPVSVSLPSNWVITSEGTLGTGDGNHNGITIVNIANSSVNGINFGIEQTPISAPVSYNITTSTYPGVIINIAASNAYADLSANDPEDGTHGTGSSFIIEDISGMNGNEIYYDINGDNILDSSELIVANRVIANYNPLRLFVKLISLGTVTTTFTYSSIDAAGNSSQSKANYTLTWSTPLPVSLLNFDAKILEENKSLLEWATAMEIDNDYFNIERSSDGINWNVIGQVDGQGTSSIVVNYSFIDAKPLDGVNYYRLRQVDFNGTNDISNIVSLNFASTSTVDISIYPNPAQEITNLNINIQELTSAIYVIYDMSGNIVSNGVVNSNNTVIETSTLSQGIYIVDVLINGKHINTRLVKSTK